MNPAVGGKPASENKNTPMAIAETGAQLSDQGVYATIFYLVVYYLMNIGAFFIVIVFQDLVGSESIDDYKGLIWRVQVSCFIHYTHPTFP